MLQAPCLEVSRCISYTNARVQIATSTRVSRSSKLHLTTPLREGREAAQKVQAQAFFDRVFKRQERHAPELVRLDADDEGGLGQTSAELFGPLASSN